MVKPSRVVEGGRAGLRTMTMDNTNNDEQRELWYVMQIYGSNSQAEAEWLMVQLRSHEWMVIRTNEEGPSDAAEIIGSIWEDMTNGDVFQYR